MYGVPHGLCVPAILLGLTRQPTACQSAAQGGHTTVVIDVNWRPVFWDDEAAAKAAVLDYIQQAHILKVTDEVSNAGCRRAALTALGQCDGFWARQAGWANS